MKFQPKTKEQQHEENLKTLRALRPIDDDFMRELFRNDLPLAQMICTMSCLPKKHAITKMTRKEQLICVN